MSPAGRGPRLAAVLLPLALPGCARRAVDDPCGEQHRLQLEVRSAAGVLQLSARAAATPERATLCDGAGRAVGAVAATGRGSQLESPAGDAQAVLTVPAASSDDDARLELRPPGCTPGRPERACPVLRLHQGAGLLRLLDERGVPLGQIGEPDPAEPSRPGDPDGGQASPRGGGGGGGGRALVFDPGGRGVATAERVEPQDETRLAVRAADGTTRFLVLGARAPRAAAALALPSLGLAERVLLLRHLDRPRP